MRLPRIALRCLGNIRQFVYPCATGQRGRSGSGYMSKLSWHEIRQRAIQFSREWKDARDERAEAQTFWNEFFDVYGVRRRTVAAFEDPVKTLRIASCVTTQLKT